MEPVNHRSRWMYWVMHQTSLIKVLSLEKSLISDIFANIKTKITLFFSATHFTLHTRGSCLNLFQNGTLKELKINHILCIALILLGSEVRHMTLKNWNSLICWPPCRRFGDRDTSKSRVIISSMKTQMRKIRVDFISQNSLKITKTATLPASNQ